MTTKPVQTLSTDICVIGGAGAGLTAAVRAKELGVKKIVVLDKMKSMGGCTRMAMGIFSVESPVQKRMGIREFVDDCYKFHMDTSQWFPDARLVRKWMCNTGKVIGWLEDQGCKFVNVISFNGFGLRRLHHETQNRTGYTIVQTLLRRCRETGIDLRTEARAIKLIKDSSGAVTGVKALAKGEELNISCKCVIIATGSISNNQELIKRFYPDQDYSNIKIMAAVPHNTGDGLLMAEEIGAASTPISTLYIGPHNHPYNEQTGTLLRRPHLIKVNRDGERFMDESIPMNRDWGWMSSVAVDRQPGKFCYALMDDKILRDMQKNKRMYASYETMASLKKPIGRKNQLDNIDEESKKSPFPSDLTAWLDTVDENIRSEEKAGRVKVGGNLDEIAQWIGVKPATLKNTIDEYNTFCKNKYDADFLKEAEYLLPINTPPFYAFKAYSGIDTCIGGLRINHNQEVVNRELYPIKGLYAAGVVVGGWCAAGYGFPGSEMSFTTYSGYAAGENAAKFINSPA